MTGVCKYRTENESRESKQRIEVETRNRDIEQKQRTEVGNDKQEMAGRK